MYGALGCVGSPGRSELWHKPKPGQYQTLLCSMALHSLGPRAPGHHFAGAPTLTYATALDLARRLSQETQRMTDRTGTRVIVTETVPQTKLSCPNTPRKGFYVQGSFFTMFLNLFFPQRSHSVAVIRTVSTLNHK